MEHKATMRLLALTTAVMMGLAGCGGSGAGAGGPAQQAQPDPTTPDPATPDPGTGAATVGSVVVGASAPTISSDGATPIDISALVKNANNVGMSGEVVTFSTTDAGSILAVTKGTSDETGLAQASLRIIDATARTININANAGSRQGTIAVRVAGTSLTVSGQNVMAFNGKTPFVVSVRNASNVGVPGVPVQLRSTSGNLISEVTTGSGTTDSSGQAKFLIEGRVAGADRLVATALGVTQFNEVSVSGDVASFDTPAPAAEVVVNAPADIVVRFLSGGAPLAGTAIQLAATRGTLGATTGTTDADGVFRTTLISPQAGFATVSALAASGTATSVDFEFVSRTPAAMDLQASPTTVATNAAGMTSNSSELIAKVRDVAGNPVKGIRVDFSAAADPSGGTISPPFALTNSAGVASTAFIAGPNPSGPNAVRITSSIPGTAVGSTQAAQLTTVADALAVRMNTGNLIELPDSTTYQMPWAVVVSDAAGNPVANARVTASYTPRRFIKGTYVNTGTAWGTAPTATCDSEDANGNGILDSGEDLDGDGVLEPSNIASVFVTSADGKTDNTGFAYLGVKYPKGFANWTEIELQVTITATSGTEVSTSRTFWLMPAVADMSTAISPPGGVPSPFGTAGSCADPN